MHDRDQIRYCEACAAQASRRWYHGPHRAAILQKRKAARARLTPPQRAARDAAAYVYTLLARRRIERSPCVVCRNPRPAPHHPDSARQREFIWLCRRCVGEYYRRQKAEQRSAIAREGLKHLTLEQYEELAAEARSYDPRGHDDTPLFQLMLIELFLRKYVDDEEDEQETSVGS